MRGDLTVRKTRTKSGATAVQVVRYKASRCEVVKHMGSAHDDSTLQTLLAEAHRYAEAHCVQPSLFAEELAPPPAVDMRHASVIGVTHQFARSALLVCAKRCGLSELHELYLDLALMRIIEPASKLRTLQRLQEHFDVRYAERTVYRLLPRLVEQQPHIESAAIALVQNELKEPLNLVLYDVTTLYFESFKEYDFQRPGFSKDNKPQQPQIVIGLITTTSGFPVMHEVFEGNTFEGHTMLDILRRFEQRVGSACKPVIVADAAMLSTENMHQLQQQGYRYIVGARLANHSKAFIDQIDAKMPRIDKAVRRFSHTLRNSKVQVDVSIVCQFSDARYKKDKRELEKQVSRARALLDRDEPGRRARFIKKSNSKGQFEFNDELNEKAQTLLGIKGYVTNISPQDLSDEDVVRHYHDLWHVEQAFRISKSDLQARPIYHRTQDAIRSHIVTCFMALMMAKYLEIKTSVSIRRIRDELWKVHDVRIRDDRTGFVHPLRMQSESAVIKKLTELLKLENTY
ncbi:IS1634 family transposase [Orrella marina]|uniref:IS1634 family transposase n=1 Tax=Orrella marina TaxID=2163011 RepID=UPI001D131A00|nr:IS1634 family transposase [Orrella marina]